MQSPGATGTQPTIVLSNAIINKSPTNGTGGAPLTLSVSQSGNNAVAPTSKEFSKHLISSTNLYYNRIGYC